MSMTNRQALNKLLQILTIYPFRAEEALAIGKALSVLNAPTREQVERMRGKWMHKEIQSSNSVTGYFKLPECECSNCGCIVQQEANFCPHCGEPKTDEAVEMVMERMEALKDAES